MKSERPKRAKQLNVLTTPSETASDTYSEGTNRSHFQNRLWRVLFANITRAVDELYYLCEDENAKTKCSEAVELFERCKRDFEKLSERIDEQKRFEIDQAGGVSWEVRKTALGTRHTSHQPSEDGGEGLDFPLSHDLSATSLTNSASASSLASGINTKSSPASAPKSTSKLRATAAPFQPKAKASPKLSLQIPSPAKTAPGQEDEEIQEEVQARDAIYAQIEAWVEAEAQAEDAAWLQMEMDDMDSLNGKVEQGSSVLEAERACTPTDKGILNAYRDIISVDDEISPSRDPPSWSLLWTPTGQEASSSFSSPAVPRCVSK